MEEEGAHYRNEYPKLAMTDAERLESKRMDAGHAFEMHHPPISRSRLDSFGLGHGMQARIPED